MRSKVVLFILLVCSVLLTTAQTKVVKTPEGYTLMRNGAPYYVKGVGGKVNFDKMVEIGANSFRLWGDEDAQHLLDEAQKRGLTVMLGFWLQQERNGFDYNNAERVKKQTEYFKTVVDKYKNHPALLFWGIGNELDLQYTNPNVWYAVQEIAQYIHQIDPNHPTSTVTAGLDSTNLSYIIARCPDIDIYGINTYGDIGRVVQNVAKFGWTGPYMITEWGPDGHWASPQTDWKVSLEQTSTEKRIAYYKRYKNYIEANKNQCLGSYAFLWGDKQEYTETWYGLFSKDNLPTEPVDALEMVFTEKEITHPSPSILSFTMDSKEANQNVTLKADDKYTSQLTAKVGNEIDDARIRYVWRILQESTDKKAGGDEEQAATELKGLIKKGKVHNQISFRAPAEEGYYRLFVSAICNGKQAYANIPFKVVKRSDSDKQARFVKFKYTDMNSFNP